MSTKPGLRSRIASLIQKAPSIIFEYTTSNKGEVADRYPKWNLAELYKMAEGSWILQAMFRVIIQETMRAGWSVVPQFEVKCTACGSEFSEEVTKCPNCGGGDLIKPNPRNLMKINKLLGKPNENRQTWSDILSSIIYHDLVADAWYLSIAYAPVKALKTYAPKEIYVEDPRVFKVIEDDRGRLGDPTKFFCPICFPEADPNTYPRKGKCPKCGIELKNPAYKEEVGTDVKNYFTIDQIVSGSTYRVLPYTFGSPRMVSIWEILHVARSMDAWFYDTYKYGRVSKIINFPGYTPDQVKALALMVQQREQETSTVDPLRGEARMDRRLKSLFLGSAQPIGVYDLVPDPEKMQSMEYYMMVVNAIAGTYGVQLMYVSQPERGAARGGSSQTAIRIEVQNKTIEEIQRDTAETITNQLFPIFGVDDYKFQFGDLEKKDKLKNAQIDQIKATTALNWVNGGFDVVIDEDGNLDVSGEGERMQPTGLFGGGQQQRADGGTPAKPKESGSTRGEIAGTSTERQPYGTRGPDMGMGV